MAENLQWYLAQVIEEQKFEKGGNLLDVNFVLISAASAEEAYILALEAGREYEHSYLVADVETPGEWEQAEKELVTSVFRGLRNLSLIGPELAHGTEIYNDELRLLTEAETQELVIPKERQSIFKAWIPNDAEWYLAEIVKSSGQNEERYVVRLCMILIKATLPNEAFEQAMKLVNILNTGSIRFWGIHALYVIHDPLEHGAEVVCEREEDVSEEEIQQMISLKENLAVFRRAD
jgi:hypothetical protein